MKDDLIQLGMSVAALIIVAIVLMVLNANGYVPRGAGWAFIVIGALVNIVRVLFRLARAAVVRR